MQKSYDSDTTDTSNEEDNFLRRNLKNSIAAKQKNAVIARPNASSGYWLCLLLPLCFVTHYVHEPSATAPETPIIYKWLTIAAVSMTIESLCFFIYMLLDSALILKLFVSLCPGICSAFMYFMLLDKSWGYSVFWGFGITCAYQNFYIRVMRGFPRCFSFGELAVLVQGVMLFALNAILTLPKYLSKEIVATSDFERLNVIMMSALSCLLLVCFLLSQVRLLRNPLAFYPLMLLLLLAVTCMPVTEPLPIFALLNFISKDQRRLYIIELYLVMVGLTIATICYHLRHTTKATTRVRKIFHLLIVLVYVPGLLYECAFLYIATGVALAIFAVLELIRVLHVPPLALSLKHAFATFSDEKDAGELALTPFCLLIGCSLPIWISPSPCTGTAQLLLPHMAGILAVGVGDTAASVIGSRVGRTKWRNSSRSLEGTVSFVLAVLAAVILLNLTGAIPMTQTKWFVVIAATFNTALVEAFTDQIDNLVLPLVFYGIVNLA